MEKYVCMLVGVDVNDLHKLLTSMKLKNDVTKSIICMNYLNDDSLLSVYSAAKIVILPGIETFGLVGLEAMAGGNIVIMSNLVGLSTYIKHKKEGFIFEYNNSKELASYISNILDNKINNNICEHAKKKAKKFLWEKMYISYASLYNNIIKIN